MLLTSPRAVSVSILGQLSAMCTSCVCRLALIGTLQAAGGPFPWHAASGLPGGRACSYFSCTLSIQHRTRQRSLPTDAFQMNIVILFSGFSYDWIKSGPMPLCSFIRMSSSNISMVPVTPLSLSFHLFSRKGDHSQHHVRAQGLWSQTHSNSI